MDSRVFWWQTSNLPVVFTISVTKTGLFRVGHLGMMMIPVNIFVGF